MARYNHFKLNKYKTILFFTLSIGDKFRHSDSAGKGGRTRYHFICIKTGSLSWIEERSKRENEILFDKGFEVQDYAVLNPAVVCGECGWVIMPDRPNNTTDCQECKKVFKSIN